MNILKDLQELSAKKEIPNIKPGSTVRVHQIIKEGDKERVQIFEGLVMSIGSGHGADKTFKVRKVVDGIGVERTFPIYSPMIKKIELTKDSKIRRAKLFYMRDRSGKSARLKAEFISEKELEKESEALAAQKAKEEAEKAENTAPAESNEVAEAPAEQ